MSYKNAIKHENDASMKISHSFLDLKMSLS